MFCRILYWLAPVALASFLATGFRVRLDIVSVCLDHFLVLQARNGVRTVACSYKYFGEGVVRNVCEEGAMMFGNDELFMSC